MAAFILSVIVREHPAGQEACLQNNLIASCLDLLDTKWQGLRQWVIICLGEACCSTCCLLLADHAD